jgi:hypothetical protein
MSTSCRNEQGFATKAAQPKARALCRFNLSGRINDVKTITGIWDGCAHARAMRSHASSGSGSRSATTTSNSAMSSRHLAAATAVSAVVVMNPASRNAETYRSRSTPAGDTNRTLVRAVRESSASARSARRRPIRDAEDATPPNKVGREPVRTATFTGGIPMRDVIGQPADNPRIEPDNSHPPGRVMTMRTAARPSCCLQRTPAAPFDLAAVVSIRVHATRGNRRITQTSLPTLGLNRAAASSTDSRVPRGYRMPS